MISFWHHFLVYHPKRSIIPLKATGLIAIKLSCLRQAVFHAEPFGQAAKRKLRTQWLWLPHSSRELFYEFKAMYKF